MATITRSSVLLWFQNLLGLQAGHDKIPTELNEKIQAVVDLTPQRTLVYEFNSNTTTGATTLYVTPADKDFYLTYAELSFSKDATNDGTEYYIQVYMNKAVKILRTFVQTTTAGSHYRQVFFEKPLKIDKNSLIQAYGSFAAGTQTKAAAIGGFILE